MDRNSKPGWIIRQETQIRNLRQQTKMFRRKTSEYVWRRRKIATQLKQTIQLEEINKKVLEG